MSKFSRKQTKLAKERKILYLKINSFYDNVISSLENFKSYAPDKNSNYSCCDCTKWESGDTWEGTEYGILAPGECTESNIPCYNCRNACKEHFQKEKKTGFIYRGGKNIDEDINNVMNLIEEVINDNM